MICRKVYEVQFYTKEQRALSTSVRIVMEEHFYWYNLDSLFSYFILSKYLLLLINCHLLILLSIVCISL